MNSVEHASGANPGLRSRGYGVRVPTRPPEWAQRFWSKVDRSAGPTACWPWTASRKPRGYGKFRLGRRILTASRVAFALAHDGEEPVGVRHECDNPPCCNPAHLLAGTQMENSGDMVSRGRSLRGERNPMAKLTAAQAAEVLRRHGAGERASALAREFGVSEGLVRAIRDGRCWPALPASDRRRLRALTTPADHRRIRRLVRLLVAGAITEAEAEARAVAK